MRVNRILAWPAASLVALSSSAFADDNTRADTGGGGYVELQEIIVSARRRAESLQDVPVVVNAVTSEALQKLQIKRFQDITSVVPGLDMQANANGIGTTTRLRGVNQDVNVSGDNGTVAFYLNDAPIPSSAVFQNMFDVDQIEVLRGPQGTLRGRSTPSGSITVTTHTPDLNNFGGYLDSTVGNRGAQDYNAALNLPVIDDKLAVRLAGLYDFNRADLVKSINNPALPSANSTAGRGSVRFEPFDWLRLDFTGQYQQTKTMTYDQAASFNLYDPTATASPGAPNYGTITPDQRLAVMGRQRMGDSKFEYYNWHLQVSQFGQLLSYVGSHSVSEFHAETPNGDENNFYPKLDLGSTINTFSSVLTHEIRLQNEERIFGKFDYVAGFFRQGSYAPTTDVQHVLIQPEGASLVGGTVVPLFPLGPAIEVNVPVNITTRTREESYFGSLTYHLTDADEVTAGLRRIRYQDYDRHLYINGTEQVLARNNPDPFVSTKTIYNVSYTHRFNDSLMAYASSGSSMRPAVFVLGDFTTLGFSPNELAHLQLAPETSKSYEIGMKSDWLDRRLRVNLAAYHQDFQNYPFRAGGAGVYYINGSAGGQPTVGQFNFVSAVPVKVNGFETEIAYQPSSHFDLGTTLNYSKSRIGNASLACDGVPGVGVPTLAQLQAALGAEHLGQCPGGGQRASFQPDWSGNVQAEFAMAAGTGKDAYLRGLVSWYGRSQNDPTNPYDDVPAYAIGNLYMGLRDTKGAWEVMLFCKNLTNVTRIVSLNDSPVNTTGTEVFLAPPTFSTPLGTGTFTKTGLYNNVTVTAPRQFGINLRYAFGSR